MTSSYVSAAEISALVEKVNAAAKKLEVAAGSDTHVARRDLQLEAKKLLDSLEVPNLEVWPRTYQVNVTAAVEIVSKLGLWSKFEGGKAVSLAEMVEVTQADKIMLLRIFRQLTAAGIFIDIPGPGFVLTAVGQPYLNPDQQAFNSFVINEILPSIIAMPRTLAERAYQAPTKESGTPYMWANGEELWTWLGKHPDRAQNMVAGMKALNTGNVSGDAYPFGEEFAKLDIKEDDVAMVDIAGGQGHISEEIRKRNPHIKGRFIVQDLQSTFDAVSGPPPGVEFMAHDIFTPQPVKNAHVYYYRHIIHDWNDQDCNILLQQLVPLLREQPKSKLLLVDLVLPDANASMQEAVRDFSMFPIGGQERNYGQWKELLAKNGLKIKKIWRGSEHEACVECEVL